jgi:hypothetical protein
MRLKKFALRGMIILAAVIVLCILFAGTVRNMTTAKVRFAPVKNGRLESVTELTGKVAFPQEEEVTLEIPDGLSLTVTRVMVSPGQKVKRDAQILTARVTDKEKTLDTLQKDYDDASASLDAWNRKNGDIRLTRSETQWMAAYEAARAAEKKEQEARLSLMTRLKIADTADFTEEALAGLKEDGDEAYDAWKTAEEEMKTARAAQEALNRYAVSEDIWTLLKQKQEYEEKMKTAEDKMMEIRLLSDRAESVTVPHEGYVTSVSVEKNATLTGDTLLIRMTPDGVKPVLRAELPDMKQTVQKGTTLSVNTDSWGRVETKVTDTGVTESGRPYADAEITDELTRAVGSVSTMMQGEIKLKMSTRTKETTCLVAASAVRGGGDGRYVYCVSMENSVLGRDQDGGAQARRERAGRIGKLGIRGRGAFL